MRAADQTILIVDDRPANRSYLAALLGGCGYRTVEAEDGDRALSLVQSCRPNLVLADILMPRMDGYEFVRRVRRTSSIAHTPIILLTAHYMEGEARSLADSFGVEHVLTKPIEPETIIKAVELALGKTSHRDVQGSRGRFTAAGSAPASPFPQFEEEHRRLLTDTLARKASQLEVANDRLRGLINLGRRLASARDPRELLSLFASVAGDLVGAEYLLMAVIDRQVSEGAMAKPGACGAGQDSTFPPPESGPSIKHILANGRDPTVVGRISSAAVVAELLRKHGDTNAAVRVSISSGAGGGASESASGTGGDAPHVHEGSTAATLPEPFGLLAPEVMITPIVTACRQYGLLVFGGLRVEAATDDSIASLAQSMGAVLGVAYENAIRYEQIEHHARRLQDEIMERRLAEERIARLNAELEQRVADRTAELRHSHERLRQSERMASLGTLCAGLGHDMGNLLLPIRIRLDLIEEQGAGLMSPEDAPDGRARTRDAAALEHVQAIRQCITYIGDLTQGLRLLSLDPEEEASQPTTTDLGEWWDQVQPLMRSALPGRIALKGILPDESATIALSQHRLTQAVFNLIQNAGDAIRMHRPDSAEAGCVVVRAELKASGAGSPEPGEEAASEERAADTGCVTPDICVLSVSDNGPGMADEVRRRAVEPFFTTKSRGLSTGLGLSLVHGIVTGVNGTIEIDSAPGEGTRIQLTLPLVSSSAETPCQSPRRGGHAVVSIEQPRLRALSISMLELLGCHVSERPADQVATWSEDEPCGIEDDTVWVTEAHRTLPESIEHFLARGAGRRVAIVGADAPEAAPPGCIHLGQNPTTAQLRSELKRLFSDRSLAAEPVRG